MEDILQKDTPEYRKSQIEKMRKTAVKYLKEHPGSKVPKQFQNLMPGFNSDMKIQKRLTSPTGIMAQTIFGLPEAAKKVFTYPVKKTKAAVKRYLGK